MYYWATIRDQNNCKEHSLPSGAFPVPLYGFIKLQNQVLCTKTELHTMEKDHTKGSHACIVHYNVQDLVQSLELHGKCEIKSPKLIKRMLVPWNQLIRIIQEALLVKTNIS